MILWIACIFKAPTAWPAAATQGDLLQKGLAAYQNKQFPEARDAFQKLLDQGDMTPGILSDLALTVYQLDQKPLALALWRKALSMQPNFRPAVKGRDFLEKKMQMRPLERDSLNLWTHRSLEQISFYELLWLNALSLAVAGWLLIRYWGERRAAVEQELPMPNFPMLGGLFAAILLFAMTVTTLKTKDFMTERATVTAAHTSVRSLPAEDGVSLYEISGGSEVLVRQKQSGWTQVQNSEGAAGWIKDSEILQTN